ncbi:MAG: hypothetical protein L6407_09435 [Candidatus Delongbacteria bacterium]|nr:hypothetical protein [Candidatus Delongbacteria bacterium]
MAYKALGADTYDVSLSDGIVAQDSIQVSISTTGAGTYNYFKPAWCSDYLTNYEITLSVGLPQIVIMPVGTKMYSGAAGSITEISAGKLYITYIG